MHFFRWGAQMIKNATPVGLILGGTALVLTIPVIRKGLRCAAVVTARSFYSIVDQAKEAKNNPIRNEEANAQ